MSRPTRSVERVLVDLLSKREITENGCWLWTGSLAKGYGKFRWDGKILLVHRFVYEQFVGPIPDGLTIDHVKTRGCASKRCFNPAHLEPVTGAENTRRAQPELCKRGHDLADAAIRSNGTKRCKICAAMRARERRAGLR